MMLCEQVANTEAELGKTFNKIKCNHQKEAESVLMEIYATNDELDEIIEKRALYDDACEVLKDFEAHNFK